MHYLQYTSILDSYHKMYTFDIYYIDGAQYINAINNMSFMLWKYPPLHHHMPPWLLLGMSCGLLENKIPGLYISLSYNGWDIFQFVDIDQYLNVIRWMKLIQLITKYVFLR